jgi:N-acetylmuramoyl-L-alanine amidase
MLTQINHPGNNYLSRVMTLPLLFILFCAFAPKIRMADHHPLKSAKTLTVVVDAGHGGIDPGAQSDGIAEKDLALSIARKIRELSGEYNINVIMTRERDELPGGGHDIREALLYRANLVTQTKADLFLSIHVMADPGDKKANGFDMYIPGDGSTVHQKSVEFGSILSARISRDYKTAPDLKQRETPGILVLKNARVPAVLVECGYLTNDKDLAFISQAKNQEKIARDMLESIVQFGDNKTSYNTSREDLLSDTLKPQRKIKEIHFDKEENKVIVLMKDGDSLAVRKVQLRKEPPQGNLKAKDGAADGHFPERNPAWAAGL